MTKHIVASVLVCIAFLGSLAGCHYRITDPQSGRTYYTTNYKDYKSTGSIRFKDARTGKTVTLNAWESELIPEKQYKAHVSDKP